MKDTSKSPSLDVLQLAVWELIISEFILSNGDISHVIKNGDDSSLSCVGIMYHEPRHW